MRTPTTIIIASLVATAALVAAGCGGSETTGTAKDDGAATLPNRVTVKMGEWLFRADHARVKAGKVTVTARNVGDIEHELIALRTDLPADEMPMTSEGLDADKAGELVIGEPHGHGDDEHMDEADEHMDEADEEGHLAAGETRRYQVDLKPGKYVLLCSIPGHYQMGQYLALVAVR